MSPNFVIICNKQKKKKLFQNASKVSEYLLSLSVPNPLQISKQFTA